MNTPSNDQVKALQHGSDIDLLKTIIDQTDAAIQYKIDMIAQQKESIKRNELHVRGEKLTRQLLNQKLNSLMAEKNKQQEVVHGSLPSERSLNEIHPH